MPEEETQLDDENDDAETRLELTNLILDGRITEAIDLGYGLTNSDLGNHCQRSEKECSEIFNC